MTKPAVNLKFQISNLESKNEPPHVGSYRQRRTPHSALRTPNFYYSSSSSVQWRTMPSYSCSSELWKKRLSLELESLPLSPLEEESFFALAIKSARSFAKAAARAGASAISKYFFPSIQVCWQTVNESSGGFDQMTKSPSLPTSSEPTRSSTRSCFAGLMVTNFSASSSGVPPNFTAFAASK